MALKPLKVRITGDTTQLENALGRAGRNLKGFAVAAGAAGALVAGALSAMTVQGLKAIDAQAKLARSLGTTTASMQVLERAGSLAGVSMQGIEQATKDLTRRLSQAAAGAGPAKDALAKLGLTAQGLADLPLDQRIDTINSAIRRFIPAAQQAAVAGQLFGEEGSIAISRLDSATIRQATSDIQAFGIAVSDEAAAKIEMANDAISRMTLVFDGLRNKLAVEVAPVLQSLADRFNTLASSGAVQGAIERLVAAFGSLAEIILSEDFIGTAVSGLELLANTAAGAAELMVTFSQNIEMVTVAFSGLAIALAVAGGPLTLIVGALAVALVGIAKWRGQAKAAAGETGTFENAARLAAEASDELNKALGTFSSSAGPKARAEVIALANDNHKLAASAYEAAKAEIAKAKAQVASVRETVNIGGGVLSMEAEARLSAIEASKVRNMIQAERALEQAIKDRKVAANTVMNTPVSIPAAPSIGDSSITADDISLPTLGGLGGGGGAIPGLGGAGAVTDQLAGRLEALQQGLATEREFLLEWYEEGKATLEDALENELLTHEEYIAAKTALDEEYHQKKMSMDQAASQHEIEMKRRTVDGVIGLIGSMGKKSEKLAKVAVALNAAKAISETIQNTAAASVRAIAELGPIAGPPAAARIKAYGATQVALIGANAVLSSGGGGGGGGSSAAAGAAAAPMPTQNVQIDLVGATPSQVDQYQQFADVLNEAARQGLLTNITVAG